MRIASGLVAEQHGAVRSHLVHPHIPRFRGLVGHVHIEADLCPPVELSALFIGKTANSVRVDRLAQ